MKRKITLKNSMNNYILYSNNNRGITLIALVITIVILIMLSTIVLNIVFGDDGLIGKAKYSSDSMHKEADKEQIEFAIQDYNILKYMENVGTLANELKKSSLFSNVIYDSNSKITTVTLKDCGHTYIILDNLLITDNNDIITENKQHDIIVSGNLPMGVYTLRYEDSNGIMAEYADICSIEIKDDKEDAIYQGFIEENSAPAGATNIGVYNSKGEKVDNISLGLLNLSNLGEKQYSFAAISDVHIGVQTADSDFQKALQYVENNSEIEFITICGDLSLSGIENNLNLYKTISTTYTTKPVYAISGNHEAKPGPLEMNSLQPYTDQNLYYSFTKENDIYIMLGVSNPYGNQPFLDGELQWLYETLEANRNKRCFLFMHFFPKDGSGDALDLDSGGANMMNNTQGEVFYSLLSHYSNVIYFHGDSHQAFEIQELHEMNSYDDIFGCHSIHIPSLAYPRYISDSTLVENYDASEGYIVDVYNNNIILRGRDFVNGKFLPIATYCLDTTIKNVEANTYEDPTRTIDTSLNN